MTHDKELLDKRRHFNKSLYVAITCFVIALLIPIILNWVLQWQVSDNIISDPKSSPAIWLSFWGAFLSAIGSFVMALVSYYQNDSIRQQNAARIRYENYKNEYEYFETQIINACRTHSILKFTNLYRACKFQDLEEDRFTLLNNLNEYSEELSLVSIYAVRFYEDEDTTKFYHLLANYNEFFSDREIELHEIAIHSKDVEELHVKFSDFLRKLNEKKISLEQSNELSNVGFQTLLQMRQKLYQLLQDTH